MQLSRDPSIKRSITRRALSSTKFTRAATARQGPEHSTSTKSNNLKLSSGRYHEKKMNNFFDNLGDVFQQSSARTGHKKHHTTKIQMKNKYEALLLKKSDKTKVLYWNSDPSLSALQKIVVSADFVFNQDVFWETSSGNREEKEPTKSAQKTPVDGNLQGLIKDWRVLHKNYFVVWVIRRKNTWNKLQDLVSTYDLAIHAIFYVKRKRNYTVDFSAIYEEVQRNRLKQPLPLSENFPNNLESEFVKGHQSFTIFQIVKINQKDGASFSSFEGRVPILLGVNAKAIFLRIENQPPGIDCILKYLSKAKGESASEGQIQFKLKSARVRPLEICLLSSIPNYLSQYIIKIKQREIQASVFSQRQEDFYYEQEQISTKIEEMKRRLIEQLIKEQGRAYQFEGGSSIYNFVGEMFKRNYRILEQNMLAGMQAEKRIVKRCEGEWMEGEIMLNLRIDYYEMYLN